MSWNFLDFFEANYQAMTRYIRAITLQYLKHPGHELFEEVMAEGWYIAIKEMQRFEPEREVKWTTFLWPYLVFGIQQYLQKLRQCKAERRSLKKTAWFEADLDHDTYRMQTSIFESDPYKLMPDEVYENKECVSLWQKLRHYCRKDIQICLRRSPRDLDACKRKRLSRQRQHAMHHLSCKFNALYQG